VVDGVPAAPSTAAFFIEFPTTKRNEESVEHWMITYGSYGLAPFGLLGMWVTGQKKTWGWLLSMGTQALWATYAIGTAQYGFLVGTTAYFCVYLRNWLKWRGEVPADPMTKVIAALREMDSTQQETDEYGGAEVAWYYYRDQVEDALGLDRGALDNPPSDEEEAA
jgi:hypothetical protein